jgi:ABC-type uncharacterized transport system permease subunit
LRIDFVASIIRAMMAAVMFLIAGLGMVFLNGPLVRRAAAVNRALADRVPTRWLKQLYHWQSSPGWEPFARVGLVAMGLLWTAMGVAFLVLIAVGVRVYD